jgi:hypothetical protein
MSSQSWPVSFFKGQVIAKEDTEGGSVFTIDTTLGLLTAMTAASCLICPEIGDTVLFCADDGDAFIISVLTRTDPASGATLALPSKTLVELKDLTFKTQMLTCHSAETLLESERVNIKGSVLSLGFSLVQMAAKMLTSVCGSVLTRTRNMTVEVEKSAHINSSRLTLSAREDLITKAENVEVKAVNSVKIDGQSMRLG